MAITPSDIEKKTFSTALRGYDLDEVDDFLDEMVVAVRELEDELSRARARIAELEQDPSVATAAPAQAMASSVDESAVGRALVAAHQAADQILDEARQEADRILGEARTEADTFVKERDQKQIEMEAEMAEMTGLVAGVRNQLAVLATTVADKLDEMDAVVADARTGSLPGDESSGMGIDAAVEDVIADDHDVDEWAEAGQGDDEVEADSEEGTDSGLELDLEESDGDEDGEGAGSAEIEGVSSEDEGRHGF